MKIIAAVIFLALNFYIYHFVGEADAVPTRQTFDGFPLSLGDWRCDQPERMPSEIEERLGVTDYLLCTYFQNQGAQAVGVYVGYNAFQVRHGAGGKAAASIHPPKHCLPGSGWDIIGAEQVSLDVPGLPQRPATVNRLVIAKGEYRQLVYYWYQSRGRVIADDWKKVVNLFWDRATRQRSDGSLVRFTIPMVQGREEEAEQAFRELATLLLPELPAYVPE